MLPVRAQVGHNARVRRFALPALAVLLLAGPAQADWLIPKRGKKVQGRIVKDDASGVVLNIYFSPNQNVTNKDHLVRLPRDAVKEIVREAPPIVAFYRQLVALGADDKAGLLALGDEAKNKKLKHHARMAYALAHAIDENDASSLAKLGGPSKWRAEKKGRVELDAALRDALKAYIAEDDKKARAIQVDAIRKLGLKASAGMLERLRLSAREPVGLHENQPVSWNAPAHPGAVMTIFVPKGYTPLRAWPLVIGLHGGGPGGKEGDEVVGSGPSAMNFYRRQAAKHGYLVVCPTALMASWGRKPNEQLVRDVMREMTARFNVDLDRVYLTGHSMGGYGTWSLGPRMAEDLAAISPMAGQGRGGINELVKTKTPIFIYHSDDDYIDVSTDRQAAKQLKETDLDFVYTELAGKGHGYPPEIERELFTFLAPRRRYRKRRKSAWPVHSLLRPVTTEDERYLGDPAMHLTDEAPALDERIKQLALGGGCAVRAVDALEQERPEGVAKAMAKIVGAGKAPFTSRAYAARLLGALGAVDAASSALKKAVKVAPSKDESLVVIEAARAIGALKDASAIKALSGAVQAWATFYESKLMSGAMRFADWERAIPVLTALVESMARAAASPASVKSVAKHIVDRVLSPAHEIKTSDRVPQDPSVLRKHLARGVGALYAAGDASDAQWAALLKALKQDAAARSAAEGQRTAEPVGATE